MTPTENLEAGAGDLVERLLTDAAYLGIKNGSLPVIGRDCAEAAAQLAAMTAEMDDLAKEVEAAKNDIRGWMTTFVRENFPDVPQWEPLPDLLGMLSQMDNASTIARDYRAQLAAVTAENARLREALERIEAWEMPATGKFWENADGTPSDRPMQYSACYGSNGERDYVRARARAALSQEAPK